MIKEIRNIKAVALGLLMVSPVLLAKVDLQTAAQLGKSLTPIGAEKNASSNGLIPEWTGGLPVDQGVMNKKGEIEDPFTTDKPVLTITHQNAEQYKDRLSKGQLATLKRYPDTYKMVIYPTRRTAAYPQDVYRETIANATQVESASGGNGLSHYRFGVPFPIPHNGKEVIWNHITRYRSSGVAIKSSQVMVRPGGQFMEVTNDTELVYAQGIKEFHAEDNILYLYKSKVMSPSRQAGEVLLVHESLDQVAEPRKAWKYLPGQRRVRRAPIVAYDNPGRNSDNGRTADDLDMFNGAMDRYEWKLIGKKAIYIPYNSYRLYDKSASIKDIATPGHLNPDRIRYELHRVWVVEATLKEGQRHVYAKRTFYIDEDTWQISVADLYDNRGEFWRLSQSYHLQYNPDSVPWVAGDSIYDLISGRYVASGLTNSFSEPVRFNLASSKADFTPPAIRRWGR
ncbi:DUF1329 domain-containing protein [Endozoicomonas numazuensis]|uniref:Outer membrane lipoprotein-sorting protein n=1 Tax=Endozoicomonas numazuensis TaxID=1137799 RepID=A0A081NLZ4_9GAMM|nr:DUF1329 domain-containing protein [Endozoicomonas numazuensis]KEQ19467.1 hypothetical protein GZ78_05895 [Endozoicomonas numazuensis]